MTEKYYDAKNKIISKEEFETARYELLARRYEEMRNNRDNCITLGELDYYLDELEKYW